MNFQVLSRPIVVNVFETEQLQIGNWVVTKRNCFVLSPIVFTPPTRTRQDKTVLSCPCRRCEQVIMNTWMQLTYEERLGYLIYLQRRSHDPSFHRLDALQCKRAAYRQTDKQTSVWFQLLIFPSHSYSYTSINGLDSVQLMPISVTVTFKANHTDKVIYCSYCFALQEQLGNALW